MTIEIDDAGTGDLIGPAFIGALRQETDELKFWEIGLEHFCDPLWDQKSPYTETKRIIQEIVAELKVPKDETIFLCRGNIFDKAREWLKEEGYDVQDHVVEGKLQEAVEERLLDEFRALGVKDEKLSTKSGRDRYFILFRWVCRDFPNREKYVKNGFKGWKKKWRTQAKQSYEKNRRGGSRSTKNSPSNSPSRGRNRRREPPKSPPRNRLC